MFGNYKLYVIKFYDVLCCVIGGFCDSQSFFCTDYKNQILIFVVGAFFVAFLIFIRGPPFIQFEVKKIKLNGGNNEYT